MLRFLYPSGPLGKIQLALPRGRKVANIDFHPNVVSNAQMGTVFEELVRKFTELSNETAGEHFTPREVAGSGRLGTIPRTSLAPFGLFHKGASDVPE